MTCYNTLSHLVVTGMYLEKKAGTGKEMDGVTYANYLQDFPEPKWKAPLSNHCLILPHWLSYSLPLKGYGIMIEWIFLCDMLRCVSVMCMWSRRMSAQLTIPLTPNLVEVFANVEDFKLSSCRPNIYQQFTQIFHFIVFYLIYMSLLNMF